MHAYSSAQGKLHRTFALIAYYRPNYIRVLEKNFKKLIKHIHVAVDNKLASRHVLKKIAQTQLNR